MDLLQYTLDLVTAFLNPTFIKSWFFPLIALAFLATFPMIIRSLFTWR